MPKKKKRLGAHRKPSYAHRVAGAIKKLRESKAALVGRQDVEELLGVSKPTAWRILRACGAQPAPGGALLCERLALIGRLKALAAKGGMVAREAERHQRVEDQLGAMRAFVRSRNTEVAPVEEAATVRATTFGNLPAAVTFTPRRLTLEYTTFEEFLGAIGPVVFALQNDMEEIRQFIGSV